MKFASRMWRFRAEKDRKFCDGEFIAERISKSQGIHVYVWVLSGQMVQIVRGGKTSVESVNSSKIVVCCSCARGSRGKLQSIFPRIHFSEKWILGKVDVSEKWTARKSWPFGKVFRKTVQKRSWFNCTIPWIWQNSCIWAGIREVMHLWRKHFGAQKVMQCVRMRVWKRIVVVGNDHRDCRMTYL